MTFGLGSELLVVAGVALSSQLTENVGPNSAGTVSLIFSGGIVWWSGQSLGTMAAGLSSSVADKVAGAPSGAVLAEEHLWFWYSLSLFIQKGHAGCLPQKAPSSGGVTYVGVNRINSRRAKQTINAVFFFCCVVEVSQPTTFW